jgi:hydrogenase nickel incorporation protein HypA/HybF
VPARIWKCRIIVSGQPQGVAPTTEAENPMHEMSIVQGLIAIIKEEMDNAKATRLRSVRVKIGEMAGILPDALKTAFEIVTVGNEMNGAELNMDIAPLMGYCRKCNKEFKIIDYNFTCLECHSSDIDIISGREMNIVEIEVD